jgi:hypothetical protein
MSAYLRANNPRPLTRAEAQCPQCGRVFSTDAACERHKRYGLNGLVCIDPLAIGLEAVERRGMTVWYQPPSQHLLELRARQPYVPVAS